MPDVPVDILHVHKAIEIPKVPVVIISVYWWTFRKATGTYRKAKEFVWSITKQGYRNFLKILLLSPSVVDQLINLTATLFAINQRGCRSFKVSSKIMDLRKCWFFCAQESKPITLHQQQKSIMKIIPLFILGVLPFRFCETWIPSTIVGCWKWCKQTDVILFRMCSICIGKFYKRKWKTSCVCFLHAS